MAKLTIMRGVSGSGKSTKAHLLANLTGAKVVSRDDLRVLLFPSVSESDYYEVPKEEFFRNEQEVSVAQDALVSSLLKAGKDVIVDNTNIEWKFVKALAKIGYRCGAEVEVVVVDEPLDVCLKRNASRVASGGRDVKEFVIKKQYDRFKSNKSMTLDEVKPVEKYTGTPGKPKAFIVDIDGTLAHMRDLRGPFEWHNVGVDEVDEVIADIVNRLENADTCVVVMSGRDISCFDETVLWLEKHGIWFDHLFMRPAGDMRPDNLIKQELFDRHIRDNFDVMFVLDDRQQVVDMWRRMGITCLQVAESFD